MSDTTMPSDEELRNKVKHLLFEWTGGTRPLGTTEQYDILEKQTVELMELFAKALHEAEVRARIDELKSLPFTDQENGCMECMAVSIVDNRLITLTAEKEGK